MLVPAPVVALGATEEVGEGEPEDLGLPELVEVTGMEAKETDLGLGVASGEGDRDAIGEIPLTKEAPR
jgi:hypothetical protein